MSQPRKQVKELNTEILKVVNRLIKKSDIKQKMDYYTKMGLC